MENFESSDRVLKLACLGTVELTLPAALPAADLTPRALALLVYLMVTGKSQSRDHLATLFWHEDTIEQARKNLRYLLPDLRHGLGDYLLITRQSIEFNRQRPYWLDVALLRAALAPGERLGNAAKVQAALDLYQGEFLAGFTVRNAPAFETWVMHQREELHTLVVRSSYQLALDYEQKGDYQAGLAATRRILQWEPWHEAGHRLQMALLLATGQRTAALQQYLLCQQTLADELGVEPEAATTALYEQLRHGGYGKVASGKVAGGKVAESVPITQLPGHPVVQSSPPHNVPRQLTSFVGREEEVVDLYARLGNPACRLVTLVGEGGIGKTRLALAVAQRILDPEEPAPAPGEKPKSKIKNPQFPDGVWFVPLNALTITVDLADKLATAIANAVRHGLVGHHPPFQQVQNYLRDKRLLLFLDNVEHLLPALKPILARLLEHNPQISLLVTTRTLLKLAGESVKRVRGLALPARTERATLPAAMRPADIDYSSVQLFKERAQQVSHTFAINPTNWDAIVAICHFLDGLPLGIELAAAQTKYYPCEQIYQSLRQNSQLLATTKRDLPERHRNMRLVLADSWRLLTSEAAMALSRLALFPGTFSRAAAMTVADATDTILSILVDHSLLRVVSNSARSERFLLHDLVRQYAMAQLQMNAAALAQTQQRYAEYFAALLEQQLPGLFQTTAARRFLQVDLHNIRHAWQWLVAERQVALLDKTLLPLTLFHLYNGSFQEMATLCEAALGTLRPALGQTGDSAAEHIVSILLAHYAYHSAFCGQLDKALQAAQEARLLAAAIDDDQAQMLAYFSLNLIASVQGSLTVDQARTAMCFAYRCAESPPYFTTLLLADLGSARMNAGALNEAMTAYEEALRLAQEFDLRLLEAILYYRISQLQMRLGDWAKVYTLAQQALAIHQALQYIPGNLHTLSAFVMYAYAVGDYEQVLRWSKQMIIQCEMYHIHDEIELAAYVYQGKAQVHRGERTLAHQSLVAAGQRGEQLGNRVYQAWTKIALGELLLTQGAWQEALALAEAALAMTASPEAAAYRMAAQTLVALLCRRRQDWRGAAAEGDAVYTALTAGRLATQQEVPWICLTNHALWAASDNERAQAFIAYGQTWLQNQAAKISDETIRQAFLHNVPEHRRLLALARPTTVHS
ncbi:MAG: hypothetical protein DYG89_30470 [Caldilinea sp. CFX5]|nr:hypothetical protein [Caldilinea sp. CFX5]